MMYNILCFGDSITLGESDTLHGGWCDCLKRFYFDSALDQEYLQTRVYNLGIGGETTDGLAMRFEAEFLSRHIKKQNTSVIFQFGINDIVIHKNKNRVPQEYFIRNFKKCFRICEQNNAAIYSLSILPFAKADDGKVNLHGHLRHLSDVDKYNHTLCAITQSFQGTFIDLEPGVDDLFKTKYSKDGLHPTSEVHQYIFKKVKAGICG